MESTPTVHVSRHINNLESCGATDGHQGQDKCTNRWELDQLEPNKKKEKKYKMSD